MSGKMTADMGVPIASQVANRFGSSWRLEAGRPDQRKGPAYEALPHRLINGSQRPGSLAAEACGAGLLGLTVGLENDDLDVSLGVVRLEGGLDQRGSRLDVGTLAEFQDEP